MMLVNMNKGKVMVKYKILCCIRLFWS